MDLSNFRAYEGALRRVIWAKKIDDDMPRTRIEAWARRNGATGYKRADRPVTCGESLVLAYEPIEFHDCR